jgi:hypothetical protein
MDQEAAQGLRQGEVVGFLGSQTEAAATALAAEGVMPGQATERKQKVTACERQGNEAWASGRGTTGRRSETEGQR